MSERRISAAPAAITIVLVGFVLLGLYAGTYWWSVRNVDGFDVDESRGLLVPRYPVGGEIASGVFYPALCIDRRLRPDFWQFQDVQEAVCMAAPEPDLAAYDAHIKAGSKAHLTGNIEMAIDEFTTAIGVYPDGYDGYLNRGVAHQELGHWKEALADYEKARELNEADPAAWNNVAMILAACPDESIRDGNKAVQYAQKACELSGFTHPGILNTLAVAYAETGDWDAAVEMQTLAIDSAGDIEELGDDLRFGLELFEQEKPYRLKSPQ